MKKRRQVGVRLQVVSSGKSSKEFGFSKKFELGQLKQAIENVVPKLAKHEVENLRTQVYRHYIRRFRRPKVPKYGNLSKGFNELELQAFFKAIDSDKFKLLFGYQAQLGLRIGEVVNINLKEINLETRELVLKTEKAQVLDALLIPVPLFQKTTEFIQQNGKEIERADGYIFFKEWYSHSKLKHLAKDYVRGRFRHYAKLAGLDEAYGISEESEGRTARSLHRLTTHSLRYYAITSFSKQTNGNVVLTSRFARHLDPSTTMGYISTAKQELYKEIDNTFSTSEVQKLKSKLLKARNYT